MSSVIIALIGVAIQIVLSVVIAKKTAKREIGKWNERNAWNPGLSTSHPNLNTQSVQ